LATEFGDKRFMMEDGEVVFAICVDLPTTEAASGVDVTVNLYGMTDYIWWNAGVNHLVWSIDRSEQSSHRRSTTISY
jgi:hypothetical protein